MAPMPDNASTERRRSPRFELLAQAEVSGKDIRIMEVGNISTDGIFLVGVPKQYPELRPDVFVDLAISAAEDGSDDPINVACHARIVRVESGGADGSPGGFGATLQPVDEENRDRLTALLLRAASASQG